MGCCLFASVLAGAPRLAMLLWWVFQPYRMNATFHGWFWPLIGLVFLPWTTLAYIIVFPAGINGLDWVWLGLALALDLSAYGGGARSRMSNN